LLSRTLLKLRLDDYQIREEVAGVLHKLRQWRDVT
jgi:hypothetical protein